MDFNNITQLYTSAIVALAVAFVIFDVFKLILIFKKENWIQTNAEVIHSELNDKSLFFFYKICF
jgi:hypothetical protein